ncbi:MAG: hypothetical protein EA361_18800 [Bacteroidetes bacterium]|nr:MAG: hypothetical protein EA361_18800 [Bacteroidota bacterium]
MAFQIEYAKLFEVKILHHFFLNKGLDNFAQLPAEEREEILRKYDTRQIFQISPTSETLKALNGHKYIFRTTAEGIWVGLQVERNNDALTPHIIPADDLQLTFMISLKDSGFMNYTALPLNNDPGKAYLFKNTLQDAPKSFPNLTAVPPVHEPGKTYFPGDMLSDNTTVVNTLYTVLQKTDTNPGTLPWWLAESGDAQTPLYYANANDLFPVVKDILSYRVTEQDLEPSITLTNAQGEELDFPHTYLPGTYRTAQIDLTQFPGGIYNAHFHSANPAYDENIKFFLIKQQELPFGIIHINAKSDTAAFDLLDNEGNLRSPVFEIRFRNRMTHWRYAGKKFNLQSFTGSPLPLTRYGFINNVTVKGIDGQDVEGLPNAGQTPIKTEAFTHEDETRFYSEIHIN